MDSKRKTLYLLDAYALIYRAYYALNRNPRINSKGLNTSAILGFANTLQELLSKAEPEYIAVVFDPAGHSFRTEIFPDYKANREKTPEDISLAIPHIKRLIEAFGVAQITVDNYEADDVIGTLAKQAEQAGLNSIMLTPDKDYGQLVSPHIFIMKPANKGKEAELMGVKEVCDRFGVEKPEQVIDFLGLSGDAVDNIPGIAGVGPVTARKLIKQFGSIEAMVANSQDIKNPKLRARVEAAKGDALLSKKLATIHTKAPIHLSLETVAKKAIDEKIMRQLLEELEFKTFASRLFAQPAKAANNIDLFSTLETKNTTTIENNTVFTTLKDSSHQYILVDNTEKQTACLLALEKSAAFAIDTETTGLDPYTEHLVGISFTTQAHSGYYIPLSSNFESAKACLQIFAKVLSNPHKLKIGQNIKFDMLFLKRYGIELAGPFFDTMIAHYLLQPEQRHKLDLLAEQYLTYKCIAIEELIGAKGKGQKNMREIALPLIADYAIEDTDICWQLKAVFEPMLKEQSLWQLFTEVEMPLITVLADMEYQGVSIDTDSLAHIGSQLQHDLTAIETNIYNLAGESFNIASPRQLGDILFDKLKLSDKAKKTKSGQYSTSEDILNKLSNKHPIVPLVLEYRSLSKLLSTYVTALPKMLSPFDHKLHTTYNQAATATGRLSSNKPNLQNIPIRSERGKEIRQAFVAAKEGHILLAADYSQIELRIMASMSGDQAMQADFKANLDIHTATAARVYNKVIEQVDKELRRHAKTVNFGIIYGISAFGLSERLSISRKQAADIIKSYFEKYRGIEKFMEQAIETAKTQGYVETLMGRRRYLRDINSHNAIVRKFAERNAINAPIQGSSADMIKKAMINIHKSLKINNMQSKMILQVHDELVFDVPIQEQEQLRTIVEQHMIEALPLQVPIVVDINTGSNWLEAH